MSLDEIREALDLTQEDCATRLQVRQPAVARLEPRENVRLGPLRALIEAMGDGSQYVWFSLRAAWSCGSPATRWQRERPAGTFDCLLPSRRARIPDTACDADAGLVDCGSDKPLPDPLCG